MWEWRGEADLTEDSVYKHRLYVGLISVDRYKLAVKLCCS